MAPCDPTEPAVEAFRSAAALFHRPTATGIYVRRSSCVSEVSFLLADGAGEACELVGEVDGDRGMLHGGLLLTRNVFGLREPFSGLAHSAFDDKTPMEVYTELMAA